MVASLNPPSEEAPPDGEVVWQDGTTTKVPLLSPQEAIVAIKSTTSASCSVSSRAGRALQLGHDKVPWLLFPWPPIAAAMIPNRGGMNPPPTRSMRIDSKLRVRPPFFR